jgi:hypothetical protein
LKLLGVDAGCSGAVCLLNTLTGDTTVEDLQLEGDRTLNCNWFFGRLLEWEPDAAVVEGVFRPNSLVQMKGEIVACCKLFQLPITTVAVVTWKKALLGQNTSDKRISIDRCRHLYPNADLLRPTPKQTKKTVNADRAEAVLLAHYLSSTHR